MTDEMTEVAIMTGREVAVLIQRIEEPMTPEGLRVVKEEVGVATLAVGEVGEEMEIMEEVVGEVTKARVGVEEVNQVAKEENPLE